MADDLIGRLRVENVHFYGGIEQGRELRNPDGLEAAARIETLEAHVKALEGGGLARDIMMWLDFDAKTPRALFKHLERVGREIPQWLRDEPEMKNLDHVPSKGTRCVLIWRAMEEAR